MRCIERDRPEKDYVGCRIEEADEMMLMDLLCAAIPSTCWDLAPSPAMIVERFFDLFDMETVLEQELARRVDAIAAMLMTNKLRPTAGSSDTKH